MLGDALALAYALRTPFVALLYPDLPDGEVEAFPGYTTSSVWAAHLTSGTDRPETPHKEFRIVENEQGARYIHPDDEQEATEWDSGRQLIDRSLFLDRARFELSQGEEALASYLEDGDLEEVERQRSLNHVLRHSIELYIKRVQEAGGVVEDA
ncbi:hypothetical protein CATRI_00070 [Corynebacterium atrinae]|nr:hypothetical protein CATRI_00070 [Corynebacterium atrinae]